MTNIIQSDIYGEWNPWESHVPSFSNKLVSISVDTLNYSKKADYKVLYLVEPYQILPKLAKQVLRRGDEFDIIYTSNDDILSKFKHANLFLYGSTWIDIHDLDINKTNLITFVTSNKNNAPGHKLRQKIYKTLITSNFNLEHKLFCHMSPPFRSRRNDFFERASFNIAVENSRQNNYFTEKIIDCFASRTIPIYYGCPNIGNWFNKDGIITFDNVNQLISILETIDKLKYSSFLKPIEDNYNAARNFYGENDVVSRLNNRIEMDYNKWLID